MAYIYCVYKQSRSCQLPFCASPIFHFEIGDFSVYLSPHFLWSAMFHCMFTLFFVVVRKRYCLPTSYQSVRVISLIPTCLPKFHTSKHLGKRVGQTCMFTLFFLLWCENGIVYKQVIRTFVSYH